MWLRRKGLEWPVLESRMCNFLANLFTHFLSANLVNKVKNAFANAFAFSPAVA